MSIRVSLYDFFAYMIPGVFYILIAVFGLVLFGIIQLDPTLLSNLSLFMFLVLVGAGYVLGQLIDAVAYIWMRLLRGRNKIAREKAFELFHQRYPWIELHFKPEEWAILLQALKIQSPDVEADIEQLNAMSIMLRNISLGLLITSFIFFMAFITVYTHIGNLALAIIALALSFVAIDRCDIRRRWFYMSIFQVFATYHLVQEKKLDTRIQIKQYKPETMAQVEEADLTQEAAVEQAPGT